MENQNELKILKYCHLSDGTHFEQRSKEEAIELIKEIDVLLVEGHSFLYEDKFSDIKENIFIFLKTFSKKTEKFIDCGIPYEFCFRHKTKGYNLDEEEYLYRKIHELESIYNSLRSIKWAFQYFFNISDEDSSIEKKKPLVNPKIIKTYKNKENLMGGLTSNK